MQCTCSLLRHPEEKTSNLGASRRTAVTAVWLSARLLTPPSPPPPLPSLSAGSNECLRVFFFYEGNVLCLRLYFCSVSREFLHGIYSLYLSVRYVLVRECWRGNASPETKRDALRLRLHARGRDGTGAAGTMPKVYMQILLTSVKHLVLFRLASVYMRRGAIWKKKWKT